MIPNHAALWIRALPSSARDPVQHVMQQDWILLLPNPGQTLEERFSCVQ